MAGDSTLPIQAAIVAALKAALPALVGSRVYDRPPQDVAFPYVSLGAETLVPWEAQEMEGVEIDWQIDTWSRAGGRVECRQIMQAIREALHEQELAIVGHAFVRGRLQLQLTLDDPDGETVHGVQRFTFITH